MIRKTIPLLLLLGLAACGEKNMSEKKEQLRLEEPGQPEGPAQVLNSINGDPAAGTIKTAPNTVLLTGLPDHRLVTIYRSVRIQGAKEESYYEQDGYEGNAEMHYMPGLDILYGYNLLNIGNYNMTTGKMEMLFNKPVLIKSFYYPSEEPDSINKVPVLRDYFLVSVYDEDTNRDTLVNRRDLRRMYHVNAATGARTQLVPSQYSVLRSQYDAGNDAMFIFARLDENKNGMRESREPVHVFWISLKAPAVAKRMY